MSSSEALGVRKEVRLSQGIISYRESGSGETLLFIHGFLVNGDLWRKVVPELAKNYHCIVPDLPLGSHSNGCDPAADLTPPGLARLISDFTTALELKNITIVGNDTGGALTQIAVTTYPERFKRLILTNCDAFENFPPPVLVPFLWLGWLPGGVYLLGQLSKLTFVKKLLLSFVAKKPVELSIMNSYMGHLATNPATRYDTAKVLRGISNKYTQEAAKKFASFQQPVLLVWGTDDRYFTPKFAERLRQAFLKAELQYVPDSFCFVAEDQPESLISHIESFMRKEVLETVS